MKVIVEKRTVVGTLKTLVGTYSLLDSRQAPGSMGSFRFHVIDDEGFHNFIQVHGDFIVIPASLITETDVKRVLDSEEANALKDVLQAQTEEVLNS